MEFFGINLSYWIMQTVAMLLTALLIPRFRVSGPLAALLTVVTLAFFNAHFWDATLFFNLPLQPTQSTLLLLLLNGVFFWILVKLLPGIEVKGFLPALIAPVVFTLCSLGINEYGTKVDWVGVYQRSAAAIAEIKGYIKQPDQKEGVVMKAMPKSVTRDEEDSRY